MTWWDALFGGTRPESPRAPVSGTVVIEGVPTNFGASVSLCFFSVESPTSSAPFDGDPPASAATDCEKLHDDVNLHGERPPGTFRCAVDVRRPPGFYYLQLRILLYRKHEGRTLAQAEQFFFGVRPLELDATGVAALELPVRWPEMPVAELAHYGTFTPD